METMNNTMSNSTANIHNQQLGTKNILVGIVLYTIVLVTILGNALVLVAVFVNKKLQTTFNFYVVNLAVTDLAVAVTGMTFHTTDNTLGYWPFGEFLCGVWIFFDYGMTFVSVFTLILISVDRFWSVTWSEHYRRFQQRNSKRKSAISIVCIWLFMLALWLPPCIHDRLHNYKPGECIWEPSLNGGFAVVVACLGNHGSCLVLLFCYFKVFMFMRKRGRKTTPEGFERIHNVEVAIINSGIVRNSGEYLQGRSGTSHKSTTTTIHTSQQNEFSQKSHCSQEKQSVRSSKLHYAEISESVPRIQTDKLRRQKRDRAIFITLTYVVIGYVVMWIPFHVVFDVSSLCPSCVPRHVYAITFWMSYCNSTINPFLYNFSTPEFRRTFKRLVCRR